jgi:hypothetical protein
MEKRWQLGTSDARTRLRTSPWLAPPKELGVRVFDVLGDDSHRRIELAEVCREPIISSFANRRRTAERPADVARAVAPVRSPTDQSDWTRINAAIRSRSQRCPKSSRLRSCQ